MYYKLRLTIRNDGEEYDGHGFGRGIDLLLSGVEEFGSLNRSAKELGMAYSKAWRIINQAEREMGLMLIERNGVHGSTITPEGALLLSRYREMLAAADSAVQELFIRYFGDS